MVFTPRAVRRLHFFYACTQIHVQEKLPSEVQIGKQILGAFAQLFFRFDNKFIIIKQRFEKAKVLVTMYHLQLH